MKGLALHGSQTISSIDKLKRFVAEKLCAQNDFEVGVFPITDRPLFRSGKACGIYFCLFGPRSVRINAIWESKNNTILFYGSGGEKVEKVKILGHPDMTEYVAQKQLELAESK